MAAASHRRDGASSPVTWRPAAEQCPMCYGNDSLTPVGIDGDVLLYTCNRCNHICGIDDSTDDQSFAAVMVVECLDADGRPQSDVPFSSSVKVQVVECDKCGNEENDLFCVGGYDEATGRLLFECLVCDNRITMTLDGFDGNALNQVAHQSSDEEYDRNCDDADETTSIVTTNDSYEESHFDDFIDDSQLTENFEDALYAETDEDDRHQWAWSTVCPGCSNSDFDLFRVEFDPVTERPALVQCYFCDHIERFDAKSLHFTDSPFIPVSGEDFDGQHIRDRPSYYASTGRGQSKRSSYTGAARPERHQRDSNWNNTTGVHRRQPIKIRRKRITDLGRLTRGDHIAWHRWYAVWHHAIVIDVDCVKRQLTVIHNSGAAKKLDGKLASVRLEILDVDPVKEDLYRHEYEATPDSFGGEPAFYSPDEVVERAASRLGQTYNPLTFNCEHFAKWCKLGRKMSEQVGTFVNRIATVGRAAVANYADDAMFVGMSSLSKVVNPRDVTSLGVKQASNALRRVRTGPVVAGLVASVAVEGALFAKEAMEAYRKYRAGEISRDDFRQQLAKVGCECTGGVIASTAGSVIGQLVIPVPFVGSFVGCTVGNLIGRFCGAIIGKQLVNVK